MTGVLPHAGLGLPYGQVPSMTANDPGGLENGPVDSSTATREGETTATATSDTAAYRFSRHRQTDTYAPITPVDVDAVYRVLTELVEGGSAYLDHADIAESGGADTRDLCGTSISRAVGLLAEDARCPLTIERWSGPATTPTTWYVAPPEQESSAESAPDAGGDDRAE